MAKLYKIAAFVILLVAISPVRFWTTLRSLYLDNVQKANLLDFIRATTLFQTGLWLNNQSIFKEQPSSTFSSSLTDIKRVMGNYISFTKLYSSVNIEPSYHYMSPPCQADLNEMKRTLSLARSKRSFKGKKTLKLLRHAMHLDPNNPEVINEIGQLMENEWEASRSSRVLSELPDWQETSQTRSVARFNLNLDQGDCKKLIEADRYYTKALLIDPRFGSALKNHERISPHVQKLDESRLHSIDRKLWAFYQLPETHPGLRKARMEQFFKHVYHTNAMEGNTLSLAETRSILETRIAIGGRSLVEQNEVLGIDAALRYLNSTLLRQHHVTIDQILELHRRVLGFVDVAEAGKFRQTQVFIGDHTPPEPALVYALMESLVEWANSDEASAMHPIELAAIFHWKFVYIHPFYDGNGRTARLLMNYLLMRSGFPPAILRVEDRPLYFESLREANEGDLRPFIRFILNCTEHTLDEYLMVVDNKNKPNWSEFTVPDDGGVIVHKKLNLSINLTTAMVRREHYPSWMFPMSSGNDAALVGHHQTIVPTDMQRRISYIVPSADYYSPSSNATQYWSTRILAADQQDDDRAKQDPRVIYLGN